MKYIKYFMIFPLPFSPCCGAPTTQAGSATDVEYNYIHRKRLAGDKQDIMLTFTGQEVPD